MKHLYNEASINGIQHGASRSSLPNNTVRELAENPNHPNSLTAEDESTSEFPNSTSMILFADWGTKTNRQQEQLSIRIRIRTLRSMKSQDRQFA